MNKKQKKRLLPGWAVVLLDILALGTALCVFALFHHVLPKYGNGPIQNIVTVGEPPAAISQPLTTNVQATTDLTAPIGDFSAVFPASDTGADAIYSHQTDNVRATVKQHTSDGTTYYVTDVWIRNIASFKTAFAKGQYGQGIHAGFLDTVRNNHVVAAISGDYYGARAKGVVVRNGKLYRDSAFEDVCVLYEDGVMETFTKDEFQIDYAITRKAYQIWSFGPQLLKDGRPMAEFNSSVKSANPRSAIGYYEPGHYCFVTVDGRQAGYSEGMTMQSLSQLFYDLGCKAAYNLDGGQTAMMAFGDQLVNQPYNGGRESSDIIYIADDNA